MELFILGEEYLMSQAITDPAIKRVHVFSTDSGEQHKEHRYGSRLPVLWWILTSRSWIKVPINAYVLEHRDGLVLFDAGMDPAIGSDPNYISSAIGRFLLHRIFRLHIAPEDALNKKLEALGFVAADVRKAIISHLHFDHIGGIAEIPQAELLVAKDEWPQLSGAKWRQIEFAPTNDPLFASFGGCYDVMGDGSMTLLPTPGHTPGSMSMLVRSRGLPPILLVGDLTYELDLLMNDQVPGIGDAAALRSSFAKVRAMKDQLPDMLLLPAHDPKATAALRQAVKLIDSD
jgi:N-acyl homoserine lactone hydrolase